jgi:hypothetical protein
MRDFLGYVESNYGSVAEYNRSMEEDANEEENEDNEDNPFGGYEPRY